MTNVVAMPQFVPLTPDKPKRRRRRGGNGGDGGGGSLIMTAEGGVRACLANARDVLSGAAQPDIAELQQSNPMAGVLAFDEFAQRAMMMRPAPWAADAAGDDWLPRAWEELDDNQAAIWLQRHRVGVSPKVAGQAVQVVAMDRSFHPVRDFLNDLSWDGTERLDHWLSDHLGVEDTSFARQAGAKWMISAVARVFRPGCKADAVLILEGPQGARKSSALRTLGAPWFTDELSEIGSKDADQQMAGVWIIELSELDALARPEVARIKAFMSRSVDRYRPPYGTRPVDVPRQCIFAGTTNATGGYLRDPTGGRRFWPVKVGTIDIPGLEVVKAQLWAEAVHRFRQGETWWIEDPVVVAEAEDEVGQRYEGDAWEDPVIRYLGHRTEVTALAILTHAISLAPAHQDRGALMRVGHILASLGWTRKQRRNGTARQWVYVPPPGWVPPVSPPSPPAESMW